MWITWQTKSVSEELKSKTKSDSWLTRHTHNRLLNWRFLIVNQLYTHMAEILVDKDEWN